MCSGDVAPKGFFSLSRELRDKIYDMVHTLHEHVDFGIDRQLTVSFPLPRLHHISRRFRDECDSRTPSNTTIIIVQADAFFQARREQLDLPKIVHLRAMQTHQVIGKLKIELCICDDDTSSDEVFGEMNRRLRWIEGFVANACTNVNDVSATLYVDCAHHIAYAEETLEDMRSCAFAGEAQLVFEVLSGGSDDSGEVKNHIRLAVWNKSTRMWDFNYSGIAKCEKTIGIARYQEDDE